MQGLIAEEVAARPQEEKKIDDEEASEHESVLGNGGEEKKESESKEDLSQLIFTEIPIAYNSLHLHLSAISKIHKPNYPDEETLPIKEAIYEQILKMPKSRASRSTLSNFRILTPPLYVIPKSKEIERMKKEMEERKLAKEQEAVENEKDKKKKKGDDVD